MTSPSSLPEALHPVFAPLSEKIFPSLAVDSFKLSGSKVIRGLFSALIPFRVTIAPAMPSRLPRERSRLLSCRPRREQPIRAIRPKPILAVHEERIWIRSAAVTQGIGAESEGAIMEVKPPRKESRQIHFGGGSRGVRMPIGVARGRGRGRWMKCSSEGWTSRGWRLVLPMAAPAALECGRWAKTGRGKYFWDSGKSNRCEGEVEGMRRDCQ